MHLVPLELIKNRLNIDQATTDWDLTLLWISEGVSDLIESCLNRTLLTGTHTEYFDGGTEQIYLKAYPLTSVTSVKESMDAPKNWAGKTALDTDYYEIDLTRGVLWHNSGIFMEGNRAIQVIYVGGYANVGTVPVLIRECAMNQIQFFYRNRDAIGITSQSYGDGSQSTNAAWTLLPGIRNMLKKYKRAGQHGASS